MMSGRALLGRLAPWLACLGLLGVWQIAAQSPQTFVAIAPVISAGQYTPSPQIMEKLHSTPRYKLPEPLDDPARIYSSPDFYDWLTKQ